MDKRKAEASSEIHEFFDELYQVSKKEREVLRSYLSEIYDLYSTGPKFRDDKKSTKFLGLLIRILA